MKIAIDIDADGEYCGNCSCLVQEARNTYNCTAFNLLCDWHYYIEDRKGVKRCQQCLEAEIKDDQG